ncbi:hypothetical protein TRFO_19282 [Tritrichomonas foetus]|uniref:Uncharacterized protein n=1 Tax=Tritrichomonas foetus TaxID=1144522 RepID=A0A1J4KK27_9EUKA|nr:hypothetical protein TRFO_19282 [Tritrichomonas foetus]|eukprot:OHT11304.1 hypothetical protein TRFO_19282 [Tritrichomonas foetus]
MTSHETEGQSHSNSRPSTVTFNVDYDYTRHTKSRPITSNSSRTQRNLVTTAKRTKTKTADVSHITDQRQKSPNPIPSFIPEEFKREVTTPTPLRPGTGSLDVAENKWRTQVFPTESGESRDEVAMLGEWLNRVLAKNQEESDSDPLQLAANARYWFGIAYDELCRQVSSECQERAQLLSSIWKRYQSLFQRVAQLHEEERSYLISCHKERTTLLKGELDKTQAKLKQISQQYRDDQERWSNAREREETKFANMRKKLDLQVKNKRNLMLKIKSLKERLGHGPTIDDLKHNDEDELKLSSEEAGETKKAEEVSPSQVSDRVHALRQRIRNDYSHMIQVSTPLDDIAHYIDQDRQPTKAIRDLYPHLFKQLPISHSGKMRSAEWLMSTLTYFYAFRLTDLCERRFPFSYPSDRLHFVNSIKALLLRIFGTPYQTAESFFDIILTALGLAESADNHRAKMFLRFIDSGDEYLDSIYLDFYMFCIGSYNAMVADKGPMFPDNFTEEVSEIAQISHFSAVEFAKKVFFAISEGDIANSYVDQMIEKLGIEAKNPGKRVSFDLILDFMMETYRTEEKRIIEQLREQYEMDAAQYGGIVTLAQFQTLSMFSPRKLDYRGYTEMMRNTFLRSPNKTISFNELIEELHRCGMLVPFVFDRIDYDINSHNLDMLTFMRVEKKCHEDEYEAKLEKIKKNDETQYQAMQAIKAKFEQVLEANRTGLFTEVAQREFYEKFSSVESE